MDGAEDPEEHFLREIQRLVVVAQQVQGELVDHPLVLAHQVGARILITGGAALNQAGFPPVDVGPSDGAERLHGETLCHLTPEPPSTPVAPAAPFANWKPDGEESSRL